MKKISNIIGVLLIVYVVGMLCFILYSAGRIKGRIKVIGKIPRLRARLIVIYNHPDLGNCLGEVFLAAMPFYPQIFWHPFKLSPYFTPDQSNFTDKWYWFWLRPRAIAIKRGEKNNGIKGLREMIRVLEEFNGCIMHFFEGGRTRNGETFIVSEKGERVRTPSDSVGWMVNTIEAWVLPVWMSNGKAPQQSSKKLFSRPCFNPEPIVVRIGRVVKPRKFTGMNKHDVTMDIVKRLLKLADQE